MRQAKKRIQKLEESAKTVQLTPFWELLSATDDFMNKASTEQMEAALRLLDSDTLTTANDKKLLRIWFETRLDKGRSRP